MTDVEKMVWASMFVGTMRNSNRLRSERVQLAIKNAAGAVRDLRTSMRVAAYENDLDSDVLEVLKEALGESPGPEIERLCPRCDRAHFRYEQDTKTGRWYFQCTTCQMRGASAETREQALKNWNEGVGVLGADALSKVFGRYQEIFRELEDAQKAHKRKYGKLPDFFIPLSPEHQRAWELEERIERVRAWANAEIVHTNKHGVNTGDIHRAASARAVLMILDGEQ